MYVSKVVPLGLGTPGGETGRKEDAQSRGRPGMPCSARHSRKEPAFLKPFLLDASMNF